MEKIIIRNIRIEFNIFVDFLFDIETVSEHMLKNKTDYQSKTQYLLTKGYIERLKDLFYLLNLNYTNEDSLITLNYQNCDGVNILLRGAIESVIIMKLLLENDVNLYKKYYDQIDLDKNNIVSKFNGKSKYFRKFNLQNNDIYNNFEWASSIVKSKFITIPLLIKATNYDDFKKAYYLNEIMFNNNLSHPNLKNDSVILDGLFGSGNVNEILYFFEIITTLSHDLIENLKTFDIKQNNGEHLALIAKVNLPLVNTNYSLLLKQKGYKTTNISDRTKILLKIRTKEYNTLISSADSIQSNIMLFSTIALAGIRDSNPRQYKTLNKYSESMMLNFQELIIAFEKGKSLIFFTKLRYVLELIATIDILLDFDEEQMEMYQVHTDIRSVSAWNKIPEILKSYYKEIGYIDKDPLKIIVSHNDKNITINKRYLDDLKYLNNFYTTRYKMCLKNNYAKNVNGWAVNIVEKSNESPSNLKIELNFIKNNSLELSDSDNENMSDIIRGLSALTSSYCHTTAYSMNDLEKSDDALYIKESYYYLIKILKIFNDKCKRKFPILKKIESHYYNNIDQLLKKFEDYVIKNS